MVKKLVRLLKGTSYSKLQEEKKGKARSLGMKY
jgi:hypothetical protein